MSKLIKTSCIPTALVLASLAPGALQAGKLKGLVGNRCFQVARDGQPGSCRLASRFSCLEPEAESCPRREGGQPEANLVLFWCYLLNGF